MDKKGLKFNKSAKTKIAIFIFGVLFLIFLSYLVIANLPSSEVGIFEESGYSGMKISSFILNEQEVKSFNYNVSEFGIKNNFIVNKNGNIKQEIYIKNKLAKDNLYNFSTIIEISYDEIRWGGIRYKLTEEPIVLKYFYDNLTGEKVYPNIFFDDVFHKRINYRDIAEKEGYALAYEKDGKYYVELKIDNLNVKSGEEFYLDPTYSNTTLGFSTGEYGLTLPGGMVCNNTDIYLMHYANSTIYHFDWQGNKIGACSIGYSNSFGMGSNSSSLTPITDLWVLNNNGTLMLYDTECNFKESVIADIKTTLGGSFNPMGVIVNFSSIEDREVTGFLFLGYSSNYIFQTDKIGTNLTGFSTENLIDSPNWWDGFIDPNNRSRIYLGTYIPGHTYVSDYFGNNVSEYGYSAIDFGASHPRGIGTNGSNFLCADDGDNFIFNIYCDGCYVPAGDIIPPNTTTPILNSTDGTNKSNQDLNCYATLIDETQTDLTAYWRWYRNNINYLSGNKSITSGTPSLITTLDSGNISKGEQWICEITPFDGFNNGTAKNSSSITILNTAPTHINPLLKTTSGKNFSYENLTCTAQNLSDADNDNVTNIYNWFKNSQSFLALNLPFEINADDYSGNDNDGTPNGNPQFVAGKYGNKSLNFDGDDNVTILDSSTLDFDNEKTWQLWFKRSGIGAETLFDKGDGTHSNYKLEFLDDDKLKFSYSLELGWQDDSEEFDLSEGNYNQTYYNSTENAVMLNDYNGDYKSEIFNDSGKTLSFDSITWGADVPAGGELGPEDGMVGLWHMNEESGTIEDTSGENNDGTTYGNIAYGAEGKFNTALEFDGVDDYVNISHSELLFDSPITVGAWIMIDTTTGIKGIAACGYGEGTPHWLFQVNESKLRVYVKNAYYSGATSLSTGTWYHVAFSGTAATGGKIYLNGVEDGTISAWTTGGGTDVRIGTTGGPQFFDGKIDEFAIWNRSLNDSEIQEIYNKGSEAITNLSFSVRSCDDDVCSGESWEEVGESPADISSLTDNTYFQFKAEFSTNDTDYSPKLYNVTLDYKKQITEQEANITSATAITDNEWYLATITYDTNNLKLYINDTLDAQMTETSLPSHKENDLTIGQGFNGSIDEFRIYNSVLGLEQIINNYNLDYNKIVSQQTSGGDNWMCQVIPNDGEEDGDVLNSSELEVYWAIEFNVTSGEDQSQISNFEISCNNSWNVAGADSFDNFGFEPGSYECTFSKLDFYDRVKIFTADDKTINVKLSIEKWLTIEEHTWLEAIYNCIRGGDCALYNLLLEVNQTVGNIWEHTAPTDESVVTFENVTNKVVDGSNNLTIDYSVNIPIKAGYSLGAYLPVRIGFWFMDETNTTCYNQGDKPTGVEEPYCQPLIIETLGPMNGTINFTVEMRPELPAGDYSIKRIIDIDPLGVWYNYGQDVIGSFVMAETLSNYGIGLETTGESMPNTNQQGATSQESSDSSGSSDSGDSVTNVYNTYVTNEDKEDEEEDENSEEKSSSWLTGGVIGTLLEGKSYILILGIFAGLFIMIVISRIRFKLKKK